jgi:hypothetical protein
MAFGALTMGNLRPKPEPSRERRGSWALFRGSRCLAALFALGCAGTAPPPRPPERPRAAPAKAVTSLDRGWGERVIWQVPIRVRLPDARSWHAASSGTFTVLEHAPTSSRLTLRVTLAPRLVRPEACEAEARLARPSMPGRGDASAIVEERTIAAPEGFDVRLVVGATPASDGVRGFALAVGAATSRCYVGLYETTAVGPRAAEEVADRLALAVSGILETMHVPNAERRISPPVGVE